MKSNLVLAIVPCLLLASCGQDVLAGMGTAPSVRTNQVVLAREGDPRYVACDTIDGKSVRTFVTTSFGFEGALNFVDVELRGPRAERGGPLHRERIEGDDVAVGRGLYTVTLTADAVARSTTSSRGTGLKADSVRVTELSPVLKRVVPSGEPVGAFQVAVKPTATTGATTEAFAVNPARVAVYASCRSVIVTDD